jgi:two-component system osmolarity sensor histidine kinase EnvZ
LTDNVRRTGARLLGRMKSGLFWRTFLLLSFLTALSMASWIGMINVFQRGPQAEQTAELLVSVVTLTKAALTHSAPDLRRELLIELVSNEGIRILTLEPDDKVEPPPSNALMPEIAAMVRASGARTPASRAASTTCPASGSASTSTATNTG